MIKLNRSYWKERKMKPFVKGLLWELCLQISMGFFIFGEMFLFIGVVSCLSLDGCKVPLVCSLSSGGAGIIGLIFSVVALYTCERKKMWKRLLTNVDLMMIVQLIGKSMYLLLS